MATVIAISNQKGGVGKTTSAVSISSELAMLGKRTLLIDFDPQANASSGVGVALLDEGRDLYDLFFGRLPLSMLIQKCPVKGLDVVPASKDLVGLEIELGKAPGRELILSSYLKEVDAAYDYVVIDCPPSSGLLTLNALGAARYVIIPLQAEYYALEGVSGLMNTIELVRQTFNPSLEILGVFMTMMDYRTNLCNQVHEEVKQFFGPVMFDTVIPRNIKLSESPSHSIPICLYDPASAGARAYRKLTLELDVRCLQKAQVREAANG